MFFSNYDFFFSVIWLFGMDTTLLFDVVRLVRAPPFELYFSCCLICMGFSICVHFFFNLFQLSFSTVMLKLIHQRLVLQAGRAAPAIASPAAVRPSHTIPRYSSSECHGRKNVRRRPTLLAGDMERCPPVDG